ncbi:hypothetical protein J1N35_037958 [Gossypium stocksii]|uniref:Uncharacterized protein n=1 Tax=Gossypium stocksii TaxID=47602 RepID=A0A9D3UMY1_9ROSI|nr:hypothetical protein J1N35_037958 [Gossypium stocksii]
MNNVGHATILEALASAKLEKKRRSVSAEPVQLTGRPLQWSSKRIDCSNPKTVHFAPNDTPIFFISFPTALKLPPPQPTPPANPVSVQAAGNRLSSLSPLIGFPRTLLLLNGRCRCTVDARSSGGLLRWSRRPISGQLLTPSIFFFGSLILFGIFSVAFFFLVHDFLRGFCKFFLLYTGAGRFFGVLFS